MVEVLVSLAIAMVAVGIVFVSLSNLNKRKALDGSVGTVVSVLHEARALTLSSSGASTYGVYFGEGQVVLFKGAVYATSTATNVVSLVHPLTAIRNVLLAASSTSVVFNRLTGATAQPGTLTVSLKENPLEYRTITISSTGIINTD